MSRDTVQDGLVVSMDYKLTVDGEVLDSSDDGGPLQFLAGYDNIVPGLEREMIGMKIGENKEVVVKAEDGYGEFDEEAFMEVPRTEFPEDMKLEEGMELYLTNKDDKPKHFNVTVVALREPTDEELDHGHVHEEGHHH